MANSQLNLLLDVIARAEPELTMPAAKKILDSQSILTGCEEVDLG